MRGLDESSYISMYLEVKHFATQYEINENTELPESILSTGHIGWHSLPVEIQHYFPTLEYAEHVEMQSIKIFNSNKKLDWPEKIIFIISYPLKDKNTFYLIRQINVAEHADQIKVRILELFIVTGPLALLFIGLTLVATQLILKRLTRPIINLGYWADSLSYIDIDKQPPDFKFTELNQVAQQQQAALKRVGTVLEKEHDFLRNASHELRTPIAVVKNNAELLERLIDDQNLLGSVKRIKRASDNMQKMIETLLWLTREDNQELEKSLVDLCAMVESIVTDNQYLLIGKNTQIHLSLNGEMIAVARTPCRLILNNLIRNAFQYTTEGEIKITADKTQINITNVNYSDTDIDHSCTDYGYGLGLHLVDRIVGKMHWQYQNLETASGRSVTINFNYRSIDLK